MRIRALPLLLIAPLGLAAALLAHEGLQAIAAFGSGAPAFATHAHTAVEPAAFVEIALVLWFLGAAVRDALATRKPPHYAFEPLRPTCLDRLPLWTALIATIAVATLFGMEFAESGRAAFCFGWLGGALVPGALVLAAAVSVAAGALSVALAGRVAGLQHLVALLAAALASLFATTFEPALSPQRTAPRHVPTSRMAPCARHAGLRAPPLATR